MSFPAGIISTELLTCLAPFIAEVERRFRHIAREEHTHLLAEMATASAEADRSEQNLTVNQAAEILGIQPQTVYEWIKSGTLLAQRMGKSNRTLRIKRGDVNAVLHARTQPDGRRKYARRVNSSMRKDAKGGAAAC